MEVTIMCIISEYIVFKLEKKKKKKEENHHLFDNICCNVVTHWMPQKINK